MIKSFRCAETKKLWEEKRSAVFSSFQRVALRKLEMLDAASAVIDLRIPPGNRLEKLSGDREGEYSIRVNDQWRVCFRWHNSNAWDVEIVDYH
jgi:proteic killer suppression protein